MMLIRGHQGCIARIKGEVIDVQVVCPAKPILVKFFFVYLATTESYE